MELSIHKSVIHHMANGNLAESLCLVCLKELDQNRESTFTKVCKNDIERSVADILEIVFQIQITEEDNYFVCPECFKDAFITYKFFLRTKTSQELCNYYANELSKNVTENELDNLNDQSVFIYLPEFVSSFEEFNVDVSYKCRGKEDFDNVIISVVDNTPCFFVQLSNGNLKEIDENHEKYSFLMAKYKEDTLQSEWKVDGRKNRMPMEYKKCPECPIQYRFLSKLKEHMKLTHSIILYVCNICKEYTTNESEHLNHLTTHRNIYICSQCNASFKKAKTMKLHLRMHERQNKLSQKPGARICELCGDVLADNDALKEHYDKKHDKKFMCFYCGKSYKLEMSFNAHIKKHEKHMSSEGYACGKCDNKFSSRYQYEEHMVTCHSKETHQCNVCKKLCITQSELVEHSKKHTRDYYCEICSRGFVDARALLWHKRLHNNERPYKCNMCSRAFVSRNRRNQHALCAHSAPTKRCPLCPSLFHLKSMVNTHIRKVHLKTQKRWNRRSKFEDVYWRTETVQLQDLSIPVQNQLLDMKTFHT